MRSPIVVRRAAAGNTDWVPLNRLQQSFNVGLGVKLSSGASLTCGVQHTFDDLWREYQDWLGTRSGTTLTIRQVNHGLSVGDWTNFGNGAAPFNTQYPVASVVDADNFTITVPNSGLTVSLSTYNMQKARVFNHITLTGLTVSADGNYSSPPVATRLNCSVYSSGFAELNIVQARG